MRRHRLNFFLVFIILASYAWMYTKPMWIFQFQAPQYPDGLELQIYMNGTTGDVSEIDIINHYIGMQKLELAAQRERAMAPFVLVMLGIFSLGVVMFGHRKKWVKLFSLPVIGFPLAFVVIFFLWLHRFGHNLNPLAPVKLPPFTPTILGTGIIGQFSTFAYPSSGFLLASVASVCMILILFRQNPIE